MTVVGETKRLIPLMDPIKQPQCSCRTSGYSDSYPRRKKAIEAQSEKNGWDIYKCQKQSVYMIDGEYYCTIHAGKAALSKLMWEQTSVSGTESSDNDKS